MTRRTTTPAQRESLTYALGAHPAYVRARHAGERVTLASLYRRGFLTRRAWRGVEGDPDAAHEYRATDELVAAVERRRCTCLDRPKPVQCPYHDVPYSGFVPDWDVDAPEHGAPCPACGNAEQVDLGSLGRRSYLRCRACGWDWSPPQGDQCGFSPLAAQPRGRSAHIVQLALEIGATVRWQQPFQSWYESHCNTAERYVSVPNPDGVDYAGHDDRADIAYFVALHELGHLACPSSQHITLKDMRHPYDDQYHTSVVLTSELDAWDWALEHAQRPITEPVARAFTFGLGGYALKNSVQRIRAALGRARSPHLAAVLHSALVNPWQVVPQSIEAVPHHVAQLALHPPALTTTTTYEQLALNTEPETPTIGGAA